MTQQALWEAVIALPETERVQLVERLLDSLGPQSDGVDEEAFADELQRRSREIDEDTAKLVSWNELKGEE